MECVPLLILDLSFLVKIEEKKKRIMQNEKHALLHNYIEGHVLKPSKLHGKKHGLLHGCVIKKTFHLGKNIVMLHVTNHVSSLFNFQPFL